jgi:hypothetical protein
LLGQYGVRAASNGKRSERYSKRSGQESGFACHHDELLHYWFNNLIIARAHYRQDACRDSGYFS